MVYEYYLNYYEDRLVLVLTVGSENSLEPKLIYITIFINVDLWLVKLKSFNTINDTFYIYYVHIIIYY